MDNPRNMRCTNFIIRALLAATCVLAIPKLALSEHGTAERQQYVSGKGSKADPLVGGGRPLQLSSRLFPASGDCVVAKIDIWLERGRATYALFLPGQRSGDRVDIRQDETGGTSMIIGGKDCPISVRIEPAANSSGNN